MESNLRTEKKLRKQHKMLKIEGALRRSDTTFDNISLVLLGSRSFYEVNRKIHFLNFKDKAHSDHKSYDLLAGCRGSLKIKFPENFQKNFFLLPTANLDYLNFFESGYQESGAGAINLSVRNGGITECCV